MEHLQQCNLVNMPRPGGLVRNRYLSGLAGSASS